MTWGDGEVTTYPVMRTSDETVVTVDVTHVYDDDYDGPVSVAVVDPQDGGASEPASVPVEVLNVTPLIDSSALTPEIDEDGIATLSGQFTDPGTGDTFTLTVDWGEGDPEVFDLPAGPRTFSVTHRYLDDDPTGPPPTATR